MPECDPALAEGEQDETVAGLYLIFSTALSDATALKPKPFDMVATYGLVLGELCRMIGDAAGDDEVGEMWLRLAFQAARSGMEQQTGDDDAGDRGAGGVH